MILYDGDLELKTSIEDELMDLNQLYKSAIDHFKFDPGHEVPEPHICINEGVLPPNGVRDNFEILSCRFGGKIVGYATFYKGYPDNHTAYIGFVYLCDKARHMGIGLRMIALLRGYFLEQGFKKIKVAVSLKNWSGLKFWHRCGFDRISMVVGDIFSAENYGCLELEKQIGANLTERAES